MAEISAVKIAKKQRYLLLLQKVKENKPLSKPQLSELGRYERMFAGENILKSEGESRSRSKVLAKKKQTKDRPKGRLPISEADVRLLGLESESMTAAESALALRGRFGTKKPARRLVDIFKQYPQLQVAWDRGRFLHKLAAQARMGKNVSEAAVKLGLKNGLGLRKLLDEDPEARDVWDQVKLALSSEIKAALIDEAKAGNAAAVRAVDGFLLEGKGRSAFEPTRVTQKQLAEITGKNRKTIHDWFTKNGLPRNADTTFDLSIFISWFEEYSVNKIRVPGGRGLGSVDPLRHTRSELLKVDLKKKLDQLLDREEVAMGQIAWVRNIVTFCDRGAASLAQLCCNQPREKIEEIARGFFRDLHAEAAKVPRELNLPDKKEKELVKFLLSLRPPEERNADIG